VREIGTLRAIGARKIQVAGSVVAEAAFLGFCAAVTGIAVGTLEALVFMQTFIAGNTGWHLEFTFPAMGALRITALVVGAAAVAGLLPAFQASRLEVKEALSYE
jgi:putative ABC transport system permease protein